MANHIKIQNDKDGGFIVVQKDHITLIAKGEDGHVRAFFKDEAVRICLKGKEGALENVVIYNVDEVVANLTK